MGQMKEGAYPFGKMPSDRETSPLQLSLGVLREREVMAPMFSC